MPKSKYEENENTKSYPAWGDLFRQYIQCVWIYVPLTGGIHSAEREVTNDVRYQECSEMTLDCSQQNGVKKPRSQGSFRFYRNFYMLYIKGSAEITQSPCSACQKSQWLFCTLQIRHIFCEAYASRKISLRSSKSPYRTFLMAMIHLEAGLAPSSSPAARSYLLSNIGFLTV